MSDNTDKTISEKLKERLNEMKGSLEHLNLQMHLGSEEAKDEYQKQKEQLGAWAKETSHKLSDLKNATGEKAEQLKASLEELQVQAALGKAESRDAIQEQQKKISSTIASLKKRFRDLYDQSEEGLEDFSDRAEHVLESYQTRLDMLKLKAHLGRAEMEDSWNERKKEVSDKINHLNRRIEEQREKSSEGWSHFSGEIKEAWSHLRKAFGGDE